MRTEWNAFMVMIIILAAVALIGCSKSDKSGTAETPKQSKAASSEDLIAKVKDGILEFNKTTKIGPAFEKYPNFKSTKWELVTTANGAKVVQVSCVFAEDLDHHYASRYLDAQFPINLDGTFSLGGVKYTYTETKEGFEKRKGWESMIKDRPAVENVLDDEQKTQVMSALYAGEDIRVFSKNNVL